MPYTVVLRGWAYTFSHRDSYIRFAEEMDRRGENITSHQGGILENFDEGMALYRKLNEGDQRAKDIEWANSLKEYHDNERQYDAKRENRSEDAQPNCRPK